MDYKIKVEYYSLTDTEEFKAEVRLFLPSDFNGLIHENFIDRSEEFRLFGEKINNSWGFRSDCGNYRTKGVTLSSKVSQKLCTEVSIKIGDINRLIQKLLNKDKDNLHDFEYVVKT